MLKIIEKAKKYLLLILIAAIVFVTATTTTKAVSQTIVVGDAEDIPAYIGGVTFATKTTSDGKYLYCLEMAKKTTMHTTATLSTERDAGIAHIILNGYPNKSYTNDRLKDYYITQTALWWYLDETTGTKNLGDQFKYEGSDEYGMRDYVRSLVNSALEAKKVGYAKTTVSVSVDNSRLSSREDYYTSDVINVTTNASTYSVALEGAPKNTKIISTTSNTEKTTFSKDEKFFIRVPVSDVTSNELNIKVNVTANGVVYKAYEYTPANTNMQAVTPGDIEPTEDKVTTSIDLSLATSKVTITKYDLMTNNPLPGAKLVLKDSNGEVVEKWTSTNEAHIIRNLADGDYSVTEEEAPVGYRLSEDKVDFTITNESTNVEVKFFNVPKEDTVINITKIDAETGNTLPGAVLVIKDQEGNEVERFTTTDSSYVITGLPYGTYTLSEIASPAGYAKSDEVMTIVLDDEHISYQIKYANYKEFQVPNTSASSMLFTIIGIVIIGSGLGFIYKNATKTK